MAAPPPAKRHCGQQEVSRTWASAPGTSRNVPSSSIGRSSDDDLCLTQEMLIDIDRQVEEERARRIKLSQSTVCQEERVRRGAVLVLPEKATGTVETENESAILVRAAVHAEEHAKLRNETEECKKELESKEKELMAKDGELKILRYRLSEQEREKNQLKNELGRAKDEQKLLLQEQKEMASAESKRLQDQLKFSENEKDRMQEQMSRFHDQSVSRVMSQSVAAVSNEASPIPSTPNETRMSDQRGVLTAANTPSATSTPPAVRHKRARNLGPDRKSFYQDDVNSSQLQPLTHPPSSPARTERFIQPEQRPASEEESSNILDSLDDGEILARLTVDFRNTSLNWSEYKLQKRVKKLNDKTLGDCLK